METDHDTDPIDTDPIDADIDDFADANAALLHDRTYRVRVYAENDALMRVRGMVRDLKPAGMYVADDPEPLVVHHMVEDREAALRFNIDSCHVWASDGELLARARHGEGVPVLLPVARRLQALGRDPDLEWKRWSER